MAKTVIIDGYNLLFQIPELRRLMERNPEGARMELLDLLERVFRKSPNRIRLVFDGDDRRAEEMVNRGNIRVDFSTYPIKADQVIKRLIDNAADPERLIIVTSDREIGDYARTSGSEVQRSQDFAGHHLFGTFEAVESKYRVTMSPEEVLEWIVLFEKRGKGTGEDPAGEDDPV